MDESTLSMGEEGGHLVAGVPSAWGPFRIIQKVGQGAFGEVYRAFDPTLEREVALKLLRHQGLGRVLGAKAMVREARALARVRHPNVVPVYGVDQHDGRVGFWSDFVRGRTLSEHLAAHGPFGPREAALIGIDLCKAVGAVHAARLLHGDIKAENAMREEGGRVLLMDFGLTHEHEDKECLQGTPAYMAPELLHGGSATIASDIYALGVLLFHLLTGKYPREGASFRSLLAAEALGVRRTLLDVRPDLPEPLARVVETAIQTDPQQRFRSAGQMIAALSDAIGLGAILVELPAGTKKNRIRAWMLIPLALLVFATPEVSTRLTSSNSPLGPAAGVRLDYEQSEDLLVNYYRPKAIENAISRLQRVIRLDERFAPAYADLARAYFLQFWQLRDPKYIHPAEEAALKALELHPNLASAHVTLGRLYTEIGRNDLATNELDEALRLDRMSADAYAALAGLYWKKGLKENVESTFQKAIDLAPSDWRYPHQLGAYYMSTSKFGEAVKQNQRAVALSPENPRAYNNLGLAYRQLNKLKEARNALETAIRLEPSFYPYTNLGMVLRDEGNYSEAVRAFEKARNLNPANYRAWGLLAAACEINNEPRAKVEETYLKAISLGEGLLKHKPNDAGILGDIGSFYASIGIAAKSVPLLRQATALAPENADILFQAGEGYELLHQRDEAVRWIGKAVAQGYSVAAIERLPNLSALRTDPRYRALVNKVH